MFSDKEKAISILKNGLYEGANYKSAFICLAKFYRYLNYNKDTTKKLIIEWLEKQFCEKIFDDIMIDMNTAIDTIYSKKYKFIEDVNVPITLEEMEQIHKLKRKSDKLVMFSMIYVSKIYSNDKGTFYITHNRIAKLTGLTRRQIIKSMTNLNEIGYLTVVTKNKTKKTIKPNMEWNGDTGKRYSLPNKYIVNIDNNGEVIFHLKDLENITNEFINCYIKCKENYKFKLNRYLREWLYKNI